MEGGFDEQGRNMAVRNREMRKIVLKEQGT